MRSVRLSRRALLRESLLPSLQVRRTTQRVGILFFVVLEQSTPASTHADRLHSFYAKNEDAASALELKKTLIAYDRSLLVADPRRMEPKKFGGRGARARRQKVCGGGADCIAANVSLSVLPINKSQNISFTFRLLSQRSRTFGMTVWRLLTARCIP